MNITDEIIKTALLGTAKYQPDVAAALQEHQAKIEAKQQDKEDGFLRYAVSALLYEACGQDPKKMQTSIFPCQEEEQRFLHPQTASILKDALKNKDEILQEYILYHGRAKEQVAPAALAPALLRRAGEKKAIRPALIAMSGVTGKWLMSINPEWRSLDSPGESEAEQWELGNLEARKRIFSKMRKRNPAEALAMLETVFSKENANVRADLIALLEPERSLDDAAFLEAQLQDRSLKVRDAAMYQLKYIRGSRINLMFLGYVQKAMTAKEERYMVFSKRLELFVDWTVQPPEGFFDCLVTKVSSKKGVSDEAFWIAQAIKAVHPDDWMPALGFSASDLIQKLEKLEQGGVILDYLLEATLRCRHLELAKAFLQFERGAQVALLKVVPKDFSLPFHGGAMAEDLPGYLDWILNDTYERLPNSAAQKLIQLLSSSPYVINQPIYRRLALHLPTELKPFLESQAQQASGDNYQMRYFAQQAAEMLAVLETREKLKF